VAVFTTLMYFILWFLHSLLLFEQKRNKMWRNCLRTLLKKAYKSPDQALNVYCCQEDVACDTVYADVPAIYDGSTTAVICVGVKTQVTDVYGIKTDKQFANTLEDNIIQCGAPLKLISDWSSHC
jgi:hypothetical protein